MQFLIMLLRLSKGKLLGTALQLAKQALTQFATNEERRAWVLKELTTKCHIPERLARALLELAVLELKPLAEKQLIET